MTIKFRIETNEVARGAAYVRILAQVLRDTTGSGFEDFIASHDAEMFAHDMDRGQPGSGISAALYGLKMFAEEHGETVPETVVKEALRRLRLASARPGDGMTPAEFKEARQKLGLDQAEMARMLGFTRPAQVSDMERSVKPITDQTARLMRAYIAGYRPDDWPEA